jgi:hypothetical protein
METDISVCDVEVVVSRIDSENLRDELTEMEINLSEVCVHT